MDPEEALSAAVSAIRGKKEAGESDDPILQRGTKRKLSATLAEEDILKLVEEAPEVQELDAVQVRQLGVRLEKAVAANAQQRGKYPDQPEKFLPSEAELDEAILALQAVAAAPSLYPVLVEARTIPCLVGLLNHENSDIAVAAVSTLQELTDSDAIAEDEDAECIIDALLAENALRLLADRVALFDEAEEEEAKAVHHAMAIVESTTEIRPKLAEVWAAQTRMLEWLLNRLRGAKKFDANTLYASELVAILLQADASSKVVPNVLGDKDGIKTLLKALSAYRNRGPGSSEEHEYLQNLFDALCAAMSGHPTNQARFGSEGIATMLALAKLGSHTRAGAIKTLDFALLRSPANCQAFVDEGGLKILFAVFMGREKESKKKSRERQTEKDATEEHVIAMVAQLFLHLADVRYLRLLRKFQENEFEKVERLVELHTAYSERVEAAERKWRAEHSGLDDEDEEDPEEGLARRMDAGLFTLQLLSLALGFLSTAGDPKLRERVAQLLNQQDIDFAAIKAVLTEYLGQMGDGEADGAGAGSAAAEDGSAAPNPRTVVDAIVKML